MNLRSTVFFITIFFLFTLIYSFSINNEKRRSNKVNYCYNLSYDDSLNIHPNNFSSISFEINFESEKKWRTAVITSLLESKLKKKDNEIEYFKKTKRSLAYINFKLPNGFKCSLRAEIRPHGKLSDHRDGSGLPSLNINLKKGHIFGITKFILFRPHTRGYDNEVIVANILQELKFLAPRTSNIEVEYSDSKQKFIFQERFSKELLEYNSKREGPLYEGDKRFFYLTSLEKFNFIKHKIVNDKWAAKSNNYLSIAQEGISVLNKVNQSNVDNLKLYPNLTADYYTLGNTVLKKDYFESLLIFDSLSYAMDASHGLSGDDRVLYFDSVYDKFYPIYYDGSPGLVDKNNKIVKISSVTLDNLGNNSSLYKGRVVPAAVKGAKQSLLMLNSINIENLNKKFVKNGVKTNLKKTKEIVNQIILNLNKLKNLNEERIYPIKANLDNDSRIVTSVGIKTSDKRFVYHDQKFGHYFVCDVFLKNCERSQFDTNSSVKLINQSLSDKNKNHLIYIGRKINQDKEGEWLHENKKTIVLDKKILKQNNLNFLLNGDIDFEIDNDNKKVTFTKNNNYGNVLFFESSLDGWQINFKNNKNLIKAYPGIDKNSLTGCVNFYDMKIKNLIININGSNCEDAVNFVRTIGSVKNVNIKDSYFDSVDADFSNLVFQDIVVEKSNNDCLDFSFGKYEIKKGEISDCKDKGISAGELSILNVTNLNIKDSKSAVTSKDYAQVFIKDSIFNNIKYCLQSYNKKQEFSGGFIKAENIICNNFEKKLQVDKASKIVKTNFIANNEF
jgi:hypothetical protein